MNSYSEEQHPLDESLNQHLTKEKGVIYSNMDTRSLEEVMGPEWVELQELKRIEKLLILISVCPPTVGEVMEDDKALDASGLNPWCVNEGRALKSDSALPWFSSLSLEWVRGKIKTLEESI